MANNQAMRLYQLNIISPVTLIDSVNLKVSFKVADLRWKRPASSKQKKQWPTLPAVFNPVPSQLKYRTASENLKT